MKEFFFDLETTGVKYWKNGIHQIAGAIVIDGTLTEEFNFKVRPNPNATIEEEALSIAGVTKQQIMQYPPMEDVYNSLIALLGKYIDKYDKYDKFFLIGYNNSSFDNQFLRAFFTQNGDNYFGSWFWSSQIDVMVLAAFELMSERAKMENFKLMTVAKQIGLSIDETKLHDASYDIQLTIQIYNAIQEKKLSKVKP